MNTDNRCRTCKHFRRTQETQASRDGWGECVMATYPDGPEETLAFAIDVSDLHADLYVSPEFGCVQHVAIF